MLYSPLESYRRIRGSDFSGRFYEKLLASSVEIRRLFARTDFERQQELFEHGVLMLLEYANGKALGQLAVERLGMLHGPSKIDVAPRLYSTWVRCLVETAAELDPEWSAGLEARWRADLQKGVDAMSRAHGERVARA